MKTRQLASFNVSAIGLGCMNLSHAYGAPPAPDVGEALIHRALDLGVTMFDTAALYGFGTNELLVGKALKAHRNEITLCSKGGMAGVSFPDGVKRVIDGRPQTLRKNCEDSLARLGTDVIDLYYLHRWDKQVPIEDSVGALSDLVRAGKIRGRSDRIQGGTGQTVNNTPLVIMWVVWRTRDAFTSLVGALTPLNTTQICTMCTSPRETLGNSSPPCLPHAQAMAW